MSVVESNLIDGDWVGSDRHRDDLDPSDLRTVVARVALATPADATRAMDVAARAASSWRAVSLQDRERILRTTAALLRERRAGIAAGISRDVGKLAAEALGEVDKSADFFDYYAGVVRLSRGDVLPDSRPGTTTLSVREPLGAVLVITPWNDPLLTPARKIAPALAAGNTVVFKPAGDSPLPAADLVRALVDAGIPPGVVALVNGETTQISPVLLAHPGLAALSFTGSTPVGNQLRIALAHRPTRVLTEMGGKNASVVLADADLDLAAATIVEAGYRQAGQRCTATSRVVVLRKVVDAFLDRFTARVNTLLVGRASDQRSTMGPVINARHARDVINHIDLAREAGAVVAVGGGRPEGPDLEHGSFVRPTVITEVTPDMALWREEVFGPVVAVQAVDTFDEAVDAVNDSPFGLAAGIFTKSLARAHEFIDRVEVGHVSVNLPTSGWDVHMPFGGTKDSGSEFREQGLDVLQFYTRGKTASIGYGY